MKKLLAVLMIAGLTLVLTVPLSVFAQEKLHVERSIGIDAPIDKVWALMGDFTDMSWNPMIVKTELTAGEATVPGAVRVLTLEDGSQISETLVSFQPEENVYTYTITESQLPISEHQGKISTTSQDGITIVNWEASYVTDNAADADTVAQTIQELFEKGLQGLKVTAEQ